MNRKQSLIHVVDLDLREEQGVITTIFFYAKDLYIVSLNKLNFNCCYI
jgi:hypothetical protein